MTTYSGEAMEDKDLLVLAVPSVFVRSTAKRMKAYLRPGQVIAGFILVLLTALAGLAVSFLISCRVTERKEY